MANDTYALTVDGSLYLGMPRPGAQTTIGAAAASMSAGQWLRINAADVPGGQAFFNDPLNGMLYDYLHKSAYDPINKQVRWLAMGHQGQMMQVVFDEQTNTWSKNGPPSWFVPGTLGHGYGHNAIDPSTGDDYHRQYGDPNGINRFNRATGAWVKTAAEPSTPYGDHGGIAWLQAIGTQGGLVAYFGDSIRRWNKATNAWDTQGTSNAGSACMAFPDKINNRVYVGGGVVLPRKWYMVQATGAPTALPDAPADMNNTDKIGFVCPVSGHLVVLASSSIGYRYDGSGWSSFTPSGAPTFTSTPGDGIVATPIPAYGVVFMQFGVTGQVWLYKYA